MSFHSQEQMRADIRQRIAEGAQVLIGTDPSESQIALSLAAEHPEVRFLLAGSGDNGALPNVGAYRARTEQPWSAVGQLAAILADSGNHCIGMILPFPSPTIVRETNAFILGARQQAPGIHVVIRWLGTTNDRLLLPSYGYAPHHYELGASARGNLYRDGWFPKVPLRLRAAPTRSILRGRRISRSTAM